MPQPTCIALYAFCDFNHEKCFLETSMLSTPEINRRKINDKYKS